MTNNCIKLKILDLRECIPLTDAASINLHKLTNLSILHFGNCPFISDETLRQLNKLTNLTILNLERVRK